MSKKSRAKRHSANHEMGTVVDSTIILGDLTDITQITRSGTVVTLHGREHPRTFALPSDEMAGHVWAALAEQASTAVEEDRQFFCVSFGQLQTENAGTTLH